MGKIDDPLDQIDSQNPDESGVALSFGGNVAAAWAALATHPIVGALGTLTAFVSDFRNRNRSESRARAFQEGFRDAVKDLEQRVWRLETAAASPAAEEAFVTGVRLAMRSARLDRARAFGRIVGATAVADNPDWQEAAAFIRDVEELGDDDVHALALLWRFQRTCARPSTSGHLQMATNANEYTKDWSKVVAAVAKSGLSKDDWYARCGRLGGFGLVQSVQPNQAYQSPDDACYRLTGRGARLLQVLGYNMDPGAYPAVRYHSTRKPVTVQDEAEDLALGPGWFHRPVMPTGDPSGRE